MKKTISVLLSTLAASALTVSNFPFQNKALASYSCVNYASQGSLSVHAREDTGTHFGSSYLRNNGSSGTFYFAAEGIWTYDSGRGSFSADGDLRRDCGNDCVINSAPVGSLVAIIVRNNGEKNSFRVGQNAQVYLNSGDRIFFMNNDTRGSYSDNRGRVYVQWQR